MVSLSNHEVRAHSYCPAFRFRDPWGSLHWLQTRVVSEEEMNRRWTDPVWAERMACVRWARSFERGLRLQQLLYI